MHDTLRLWNDNEKLIKALDIAVSEHKKLLAVITEVHSQHADDLCWMPADVNKIFEAAGLPKQDLRVGNKADMLKNCDRYVDCLESGGKWQSYAELEKERDELKAHISNDLVKKYILWYYQGIVSHIEMLLDEVGIKVEFSCVDKPNFNLQKAIANILTTLYPEKEQNIKECLDTIME